MYAALSKLLVTGQSHNSLACLHNASPRASTHTSNEHLFLHPSWLYEPFTAAASGSSASVYSYANRKWTNTIAQSKPHCFDHYFKKRVDHFFIFKMSNNGLFKANPMYLYNNQVHSQNWMHQLFNLQFNFMSFNLPLARLAAQFNFAQIQSERWYRHQKETSGCCADSGPLVLTFTFGIICFVSLLVC